MATRNGLVLISHVRNPVEVEGEADVERAVRRGALERVNPILMTALAAELALIPRALEVGEPGSEIQAPMAIVILFGLLSSTALNMLVVPALNLRFGALRFAETGDSVPRSRGACDGHAEIVTGHIRTARETLCSIAMRLERCTRTDPPANRWHAPSCAVSAGW
jgi:hypothetical protein